MSNDNNKEDQKFQNISVFSTAVSLPGLVLPAETEGEEAEDEDDGGDDGGDEDRGQADGNIQPWLGQFEILQHLVTVSEAATHLERGVREDWLTGRLRGFTCLMIVVCSSLMMGL